MVVALLRRGAREDGARRAADLSGDLGLRRGDAPGDDGDLARPNVRRREDDDEAFLGELPPVAHDIGLDRLGARVEIDAARRRGPRPDPDARPAARTPVAARDP